MTLATVRTRAQVGIDAPPVICEVQVAGGLPSLTIVGLVETAVRESRERVRAAIRESGYDFPDGRITVNLAPADLPKGSGRFDLAIAVGILAAAGRIPTQRLVNLELYGELSFSGAIRPVTALLPALQSLQADGAGCIIPADSRHEAGLMPGSGTLLAGHLAEVVDYLSGVRELPDCPPVAWPDDEAAPPDLADVVGQPAARRTLEIAAAGGHHLLFIGPPGTGKTLLAQRLTGLLPPLSDQAVVERLVLRSIAGAGKPEITRRRPFRAPHHSASTAALVGGGKPPKPGEISLAHHGVLFLDELPEFARPALEALREPLESGSIHVARAAHSVAFPARFQLVAAMNPCPCGYAGDARQDCRCTPAQVQRYRHRVSGPLLDRIDLRVELGRCAQTVAGLLGQVGDQRDVEDSRTVRRRVIRAIARQADRGSGPNGQCTGREPWLRPGPRGRELLATAAERFDLSARACAGVLRVARTIADLAGSARVCAPHIAEALSFRKG